MAPKIDILAGNLFTCVNEATDLPKFDPFISSFDCGSSGFNDSYYAFVTILMTFVIAVAIVIYSWRTRSIDQDGKMLSSEGTNVSENRPLDSLFVFLWRSLQWLHHHEPAGFPHIYKFVAQLRHIRSLMLFICLPILFLFFITYPSMSTSYGSLENEYAWQFTAAYTSGLGPSITYMLFWTISLASCFFYINKKQYTRSYLSPPSSSSSSSTSPSTTSTSQASAAQKGLLLLRVVILAASNALLVLSVNVIYVYKVSSGELDRAGQVGAKVSFVLFKLAWNGIFLPRMRVGRRLRFGLSEEFVRAHMHDELFFALLLVFNNIVAPCIATAVSDTRCFELAIQIAPSIQSAYEFLSCGGYKAGLGCKEKENSGALHTCHTNTHSYTYVYVHVYTHVMHIRTKCAHIHTYTHACASAF